MPTVLPAEPESETSICAFDRWKRLYRGHRFSEYWRWTQDLIAARWRRVVRGVLFSLAASRGPGGAA